MKKSEFRSFLWRSSYFSLLSTKTAFFMDRTHGEPEFELRLAHKRQSCHADPHA